MNEKNLQLRNLIKLGLIVAFAYLYSWGGMEMKWLRRFLAPAILCLGTFLLSRDWRTLVSLPFMIASLSLGYGANELITKIIKRLVYGLALGVSSSIYNLLKKRWLLVVFQMLFLMSVMMIFGVVSPLPSARAEEAFMGLCIAALTIFSVKDYDSNTKET